MNMKKIVAVFDGLNYNSSTEKFLIFIGEMISAHVVAVFLDDPEYHSYKIYELIAEDGVSGRIRKELDVRDQTSRLTQSKELEGQLKALKLPYTIRHDSDNAIQDVVHESNFADLMIIFRQESFVSFKEKVPSRFIKKVLENIHCPLLLVPYDFNPFNKIIWLYDGRPSSIYAYKMFNYIFEDFLKLNTEVVNIHQGIESSTLPDENLLKEYMNRHAPQATFKLMGGDVDSGLLPYLKSLPTDTLIVLGAFQRGRISRMINTSLTDWMLKNFDLPIFIAHRADPN